MKKILRTAAALAAAAALLSFAACSFDKVDNDHPDGMPTEFVTDTASTSTNPATKDNDISVTETKVTTEYGTDKGDLTPVADDDNSDEELDADEEE